MIFKKYVNKKMGENQRRSEEESVGHTINKPTTTKLL